MKRRYLLSTVARCTALGMWPGRRYSWAAAAATGWVYDPVFLTPVFGPNHPEQPRRVLAILAAMEASGLPARLRNVAPRADVEIALRLVHTEAHIAAIRIGYGEAVDALARTGVGGALAAVEAVAGGGVRNAFVCSRPPGHHARNTGREEGFCFFNNVAIAARHAQRELGLRRVLIVDWDYHHGDGTESFFYEDPTVLYFSTHDWHAYPGTGDPARRGAGAGAGYNINVPLPCGATDADIVTAFEQRLLPAANAFRPELVLVSAGFDSRADDLLGCLGVSDEGFVRLTRLVMALADRHCGGRLVSVLEGGYDPRGLASAVVAHVRALAGGRSAN
ncbi:MAG: Histone deacetylase-like amidohydrolase [Gammaproteobacteria bacterium]|nr:Histone deacetylase-like amidohydrolase [Gammaproteobacteria bacterium]